MKLQKFEQSGFILETETGYRIAFDIGNKTSLDTLAGIAPVDLCIVSHIHGDHFAPENIIKLSPEKILLPRDCRDALEELKLVGQVAMYYKMAIPAVYVITHGGFVFDNDQVKITFFDVDHGPNCTVKIENTGFLIEADGQTIYFAGDMYYPSGMDVSDLSVDYALLPVGGHYTFGPQEALDHAKSFKHIGKIIPMHYEKNNFIDPSQHDVFVKLSEGVFNLE